MSDYDWIMCRYDAFERAVLKRARDFGPEMAAAICQVFCDASEEADLVRVSAIPIDYERQVVLRVDEQTMRVPIDDAMALYKLMGVLKCVAGDDK